MVEAPRTSTRLHPPRLTSARAERPLRCLLDISTPAPSLIMVRQSVGDGTTTGSWAMVDRHIQALTQPTSTHLHPQRLTLERAERPLRFPLNIITPASSLTTVTRSVGERTTSDSWAMVEATPTPTHLHPQRLISVWAERLLRWMLESTTPAPSLTTVT